MGRVAMDTITTVPNIVKLDEYNITTAWGLITL